LNSSPIKTNKEKETQIKRKGETLGLNIKICVQMELGFWKTNMGKKNAMKK